MLLSLWEPWATLMAIGAKKIETRSWTTTYRGWLAIHASKGGLSKREMASVMEDGAFRLALAGETMRPGHIVAVVYLNTVCHTEYLTSGRMGLSLSEQEQHFGDYAPGRYGWITDRLFRLHEPLPFRAKQGLVAVPADLVEHMRSQFKGALHGPKP